MSHRPEAPMALRVAHVIPYLGAAQGGPVFNLAACAEAQVRVGCQVVIFTAMHPSDGRQLELTPGIELVHESTSGWGAYRRCRTLWEHARAGAYDLIHSHGLWTDANRMAMALARSRRLPHVLTPCGMLAPGALRHRWWKKTPIRLWFQTRALREANCLQAQSELEYQHIRRFGLPNPVAIIPAAVPGPPAHGPTAEHFRSAFPIGSSPKVVLYLGRLHAVKGLERLIEAWSRLRPSSEEWVLVLAGPDEAGFEATLRAQITAAGCGDSVLFTGCLDNQQKWSALAAAELFVMPSDFENFAISIVEAMMAQLPVITTTGTPWKQLPEEGIGWCIEPTTQPLVRALREAMQMTPDKRHAMGARAAAFARRFRPEHVAADLLQVYEWLLGNSSRPACVTIE